MCKHTTTQSAARVTIILNISDSFNEDTPRLLGKHFSNQKAEADLGQSQKAES